MSDSKNPAHFPSRNLLLRVVRFFYLRELFPHMTHKWVHSLPSETRQDWDREIIIRNIKKQRYLLQWGGLHVSHFTHYFVTLIFKYKFFLYLFFKVTFAIIAISIPCGVFIVSRWYHPVWSRFTDYRATEPISQAVFRENLPLFYKRKSDIGLKENSPKWAQQKPAGLSLTQNFEIKSFSDNTQILKWGNDLVHTQYLSGDLIWENFSKAVYFRIPNPNEPMVFIENDNEIKIEMVPLETSLQNNCKIFVTWKGAEQIYEWEFSNLSISNYRSLSSFTTKILRGFNPQFLLNSKVMNTLSIPTNLFPNELKIWTLAEQKDSSPPGDPANEQKHLCPAWIHSVGFQRGLLKSQKKYWSIHITTQIPQKQEKTLLGKMNSASKFIWVAPKFRKSSAETLEKISKNHPEIYVFSNPHYALRGALEFVYNDMSRAFAGPNRYLIYISPGVRPPLSAFSRQELLDYALKGKTHSTYENVSLRYRNQEIQLFLSALRQMGMSGHTTLDKSLTYAQN